MTLSNHLSAYPDIHEALTAALHHKGGRIRMATRGKAFYWKARANNYKSLLHKKQSASGIVETATQFDSLVIRVDPEDAAVILIEFRAFTQTFETLSGEEIDTADFGVLASGADSVDFDKVQASHSFDVAEDDELIAAATAARASIFGENS